MQRQYALIILFSFFFSISLAQVPAEELIIKKRNIGKELHGHKVSKETFDLNHDRPFSIDTLGNLQACDTVFYSWTYTTANDVEAYVSGHNDNIDSAKAEKYTGLTASQVNGLWMFFGVATYTDANLQVIHVKAWDDAGVGGVPGNILGTVDVKHSTIKADVDAGNLTTVMFPTPIAIPANGNIYCGFSMDYKKKNGKLTYDTSRAVNLLNPDFFNDCNTQEQNTAWELYSKTYGQGGEWHDYVYSWGYGNRNPVFPIVQSNSCSISFTPTDPIICKNNPVTITASGASTYDWSPATGLNTTIGAVVIANPLNTTSYTVSGDTGSCSSIITVTVNANPVISLGADTVVCDTANFTLNAGEGFSSYLWSTNETTQEINVNTSGIYSVTVKDLNGCQGSDTIDVTVDICTSQQSLENNTAISIYPNPANQNFLLSIKNSKAQTIKVEMQNMLGETLQVISGDSFTKGTEQLIDVSNFPSSIYLVKIFLGNETLVRKLIIEN